MYYMFFPWWAMSVSLQMVAFHMSVAAVGAAPLRIGRMRSRAQLSVVAYNRRVLSVRSRAVLKIVS